MSIEEGMLIGRVTEVATGRSSAELRFDLARYGWTRTSGLAGVNGGSAGSWGGTSYATASFDDVTVYRATAGTSSGGLVASSAPTSPIAPPTANSAAPQFVESYLMQDRARIRILGRCRPGRDQRPTLPAPPARLIRVGFPVFEGVPCGGRPSRYGTAAPASRPAPA